MEEALYKGNSHATGGIKVLVDGVKPIEVEGHEYLLCNKAMQSTKIFEFKNKTNKEILDEFHTYSTCEFKQNEAHSGDFIICKKVVLDTNKRNITGTIKEIINIMQSEKGCRQSNDNVFKTGGDVGENAAIKEILEKAKPFQNELTQIWVKKINEEGKITLSDWDIEMYQFGLIVDLAKAIGNYIEKYDTIEDLKFQKSQGAITISCKIIRNNKEYDFSTEVIVAGGYNVQKMHFRYIVSTKLAHQNSNAEYEKLNEQYKKMSKAQKLKEQISANENTIAKYQSSLNKAKENSELSDLEVEKLARLEEKNKNSWKLVDLTWNDLPITARENYNNDKFYYEQKKKEFKQSLINFWRTFNANYKRYEDFIVSENKKIAKLNKKLSELGISKMKTGGEIKPIRQLGTGANVYFESEKYRVNDYKGNFTLNVGDKYTAMPLKNVIFDNVDEAVFIANELEIDYPLGLTEPFNNVEKIIESYKKDYIESKNALNKGIKIESEHIDTAKKLYEHEITPKQAAESIAKEHLAESPQYYNELEKMETKLQNNNLTDMKVSIKVEDYKNEFLLNKAIEKLIDYKGANRDDYNAEEINFISYYSGYGGLGKYGTVGRELAKGLKYEYYTPDEIVKKMWGLAYKYGYGTLGDNSIFETSAGIGNFVKYAPKDVKVVCNEINKYSVKILEILYPDATIYHKYFEQNFITKNNTSMKSKIDTLDKYSLIIGNPPYGELTGKYIGMGEDAYTKAGNFCEYFITRSLDLLIKDGLLVYIVGAEQLNGGTLFLDSKMSKVKEIIFDKAHLIDAYRLPVKVFERTGVSSEILIFRKK